MNYPSAIVISAGLIAGALILNGQVQGQTPAAVGRFSVAARATMRGVVSAAHDLPFALICQLSGR